jgi:hypothetical protein
LQIRGEDAGRWVEGHGVGGILWCTAAACNRRSQGTAQLGHSDGGSVTGGGFLCSWWRYCRASGGGGAHGVQEGEGHAQGVTRGRRVAHGGLGLASWAAGTRCTGWEGKVQGMFK